jgi:hypothetical protein
MKIGAVEAILYSAKECLSLYLSASNIRGVHMVLFGIDGFRKKWRREGRAVFVGINEIVFTRVPWNRIPLF